MDTIIYSIVQSFFFFEKNTEIKSGMCKTDDLYTPIFVYINDIKTGQKNMKIERPKKRKARMVKKITTLHMTKAAFLNHKEKYRY